MTQPNVIVFGTATSDDYDDVVYLVGVDFHYEKDTVGSKTRTAK